MATGRAREKVEAEIKYTDSETHRVHEINKLDDATFENDVAKGKLVADQVAENGGTGYGEQTLVRMAEHPDMQCSDETLRRCWHIYELMAIYGERLRQAAPTRKSGHYYALSRLLQIPDAVEQEKAVFGMAELAEKDRLVATDLEQRVTNHLNRVVPKPVRKKPDQTENTGDDAPKRTYEEFFTKTKTVINDVEQIIASNEIRKVSEVNKAAKRLSFAYCTLAERLVRDGEDEAVDGVHKTIRSLNAIVEGQPLGAPDLDAQMPLGISGPVASSCGRTKARTPHAATVTAASVISLDMAKSLEWPPVAGMKVVVPARAMQIAFSRACIAALTEEGQSEIARASNETRGCVKIVATGDGIVIESAVSRFQCRHVLHPCDGVAVVEQGEACIPAKELKDACSKLLAGCDAFSLSFIPGQDEPVPEKCKAMVPVGKVMICAVRGSRIVAKVEILSYDPACLQSIEYPSIDSLKLVFSGEVAAIKAVYRAAAIAINPKDINEILNKLAIFDGGDTVYFCGSGMQGYVIIPVNKSEFETASDFGRYGTVGAVDDSTAPRQMPIPVQINVEYLAPILRATAKDDIMTITTDESLDYVYLHCGASTYSVSQLEESMAIKYPDYRKRLSMPIGAVLLVNRLDCQVALEALRQASEDCMKCTVLPDGKLRLTGNGYAVIQGAESTLTCEQASLNPLKCATVSLNTDYFYQVVRQLKAEKIRISFSQCERAVRIEDESDPESFHFIRVINPGQNA